MHITGSPELRAAIAALCSERITPGDVLKGGREIFAYLRTLEG